MKSAGGARRVSEAVRSQKRWPSRPVIDQIIRSRIGNKLKRLSINRQTMSGSGPLGGIGKVAFWGSSPAKDLLGLINDKAKLRSDSGPKRINILLAGETDSRHALKTLHENWELLQQNDIRINFYIVESFLEQYARQMLFWTLALQPLNRVGLYEKTVQFMELYGNSLIRPQTKQALMELVDELVKMTTNEASSSMFDLSEMKYRERDALVEIFKHWRTFSNPDRFSISKHWSGRVARHLGTRYDSRMNVFDWDYNMKLLGKGAKIISSHEFKKWRESGIAFAEFDSDYSQPNLTLATGISNTGSIQLSYWGDIVTGPFISYGIECEDKSLFEKANERYKNKAYDVTFHNLEKIFQTISPRESVGENGDEKSVMDMISIHFISPLTFGRAGLYAKYGKAFFDILYFGNSMVQQILPPLSTVIAPDAILLAENVFFILETRADQSQLYDEKVRELGTKAGLETIEISGAEGDNTEFPCFLQFVPIGELASGNDEVNFAAAADTKAEIIHVEKVKEDHSDSETKIYDQDQNIQKISCEVEISPKGDA